RGRGSRAGRGREGPGDPPRQVHAGHADEGRERLMDGTTTTEYTVQSARDAQRIGYGGKSYWAYLEKAAYETRDYYLRHEQPGLAEEMLTRSLGEALRGN